MRNIDKTAVVTYLVLAVIAVSMFAWIYALTPSKDSSAAVNMINRTSQQTTVSEDTVAEDVQAPAATATPTPFVKEKSKEVDQGCIGDEGLVW